MNYANFCCDRCRDKVQLPANASYEQRKCLKCGSRYQREITDSDIQTTDHSSAKMPKRLVLLLIVLAFLLVGKFTNFFNKNNQNTIPVLQTSPIDSKKILADIGYLSPIFCPLGYQGNPSPGISGFTSKNKTGQIIREGRRNWVKNSDDMISMPNPTTPLYEDTINNLVTGEVSVNTYGLHPFPINRITSQYVIENTYNNNSVWLTSSIYQNKGTLQNPSKGNLLWLYETINITNQMTDLSSIDYKYKAKIFDTIRNITIFVTYDNANYYRKISEEYEDKINDTKFLVNKQYSYSEDFFNGEIPTTILLTNNNTVNKIQIKDKAMLLEIYNSVGEFNMINVVKKDANSRDANGITDLMKASAIGNSVEIKRLISMGANIDARDNGGNTALMYAANKDQATSVNTLIELGADVNVKSNKYNETALISAAHLGHAEVVKALIAGKADINSKITLGQTAFILAASYGHVDVVKLLIEAGADVNAKYVRGDTALIFASNSGNIELINMLLSNKAEINTRNDNGETALMNAVASPDERTEAVSLLVAKGADVNLTDSEGKTALMTAVAVGHFDIANILLKNGANPNAKDLNGGTPAMYASLFGQDATLKALINSGANLNVKDKLGKTAAIPGLDMTVRRRRGMSKRKALA